MRYMVQKFDLLVDGVAVSCVGKGAQRGWFVFPLSSELCHVLSMRGFRAIPMAVGIGIVGALHTACGFRCLTGLAGTFSNQKGGFGGRVLSIYVVCLEPRHTIFPGAVGPLPIVAVASEVGAVGGVGH